MESTNRVSHFISSLIKYHRVWIATLLLGVLAAGVYAFFLKQDSWTARQSLIIRDDLLGSPFKPGRFESLESMKSAQETVLEVARKPQVIRSTLKKLGPEASSMFGKGGDKNWPSEKAIEEIQGAISFSAPNGAEFGKTEVIVLNAKSSTRERSLKFIEILLDEVDIALSQVRKEKLESMVAEISQANLSAREMMDEAANRLREMEGKLGSDISTMRSMNEPMAGTSAFDSKLNEIRAEKRGAEAELASVLKQRELMDEARHNPDFDLATSSELLTLQPALGSLVQGMATAQLAEAEALGKYWPTHPTVREAQETVRASRQKIYTSIGPSISGIESQVRVLQEKVNRLDGLLREYESRMSDLTALRVPYATLEQEVNKKREIFNESQGRQAEMESLAKTAASADLLTRVGLPQVSTRPDGLSKRALGMAGAIGGLMMGIGLVLLMAPPFHDPNFSQTSMASPVPNDSNENRTSPPVQTEQPTKAASKPKDTAATGSTIAANRLQAIMAQTSGREPVPEKPSPQVPLSESIAAKLSALENAPVETAPSTKPEIVVTTAAARSSETPPPKAIIDNLDASPAQPSGFTVERTKTTIMPKTDSQPPAQAPPAQAPVAESTKPDVSPESVSETETVAQIAAAFGTSEQVANQLNSLSKDLSGVAMPEAIAPRESMPTIQMEAQSAIDSAGALPLRRRGTKTDPQSRQQTTPAQPAQSAPANPTSQSAIDKAFSGIQSESKPLSSNPFINPTGKRENPFAKDRGQAVESAPAPKQTGTSATARAIQPKQGLQPAAEPTAPAAQQFEKIDPSIQLPPIPTTNVENNALPIPAQIRKLSDSILSFAKPADDE